MMAARDPRITMDEAPGVVASVVRIDAWLAVAQAGDRFVYASRAVLPIASAGAARMRDLAKRDVVMLFRPRSTVDPTIFNYLAVRTSTPIVGAKPAGRPKLVAIADPIVDDEVEVTNALLAVLERFANAGRPCPTDTQLGDRCGIPKERVPAVLAAMRSANLIRVFPVPAPTARRVHIVSTGAMTGFVREGRCG